MFGFHAQTLIQFFFQSAFKRAKSFFVKKRSKPDNNNGAKGVPDKAANYGFLMEPMLASATDNSCVGVIKDSGTTKMSVDALLNSDSQKNPTAVTSSAPEADKTAGDNVGNGGREEKINSDDDKRSKLGQGPTTGCLVAHTVGYATDQSVADVMDVANTIDKSSPTHQPTSGQSLGTEDDPTTTGESAPRSTYDASRTIKDAEDTSPLAAAYNHTGDFEEDNQAKKKEKKSKKSQKHKRTARDDESNGNADDDGNGNDAGSGTVDTASQGSRQTNRKMTRRPKAITAPYTWERDDNQAVARPFKGNRDALTHINAEFFLTSPDFEDYYSTPNTRVENPEEHDLFFFQDVNSREVIEVAGMDGFRWRSKRFTESGEYRKYSFSAETRHSNVYHTQLTKTLIYDTRSRRFVMQYRGDTKLGYPYPPVLQHYPRNFWPPKPPAPHPNDISGGGQERLEKYTKYYQSLPEERQLPETMKVGKIRKAPQPDTDKGGEDSLGSLTDEEGFSLDPKEPQQLQNMAKSKGKQIDFGQKQPRRAANVDSTVASPGAIDVVKPRKIKFRFPSRKNIFCLNCCGIPASEDEET